MTNLTTKQIAEELAATRMQEMIEAMLAEGAEIEEPQEVATTPMFAY